MKLSFLINLGLMGLAVVALSLTSKAVFAHGGREVGPYELMVGFMVEPAYEGLMNGVELQVKSEDTAAPVEGLAQSLQVEVTHVSSGASKTLALQPVFDNPGQYTANLIPTAPGHYRFRFLGTIEGLAVDETFDSGAGDFDEVVSASALQFPEQLPAQRELAGALRGTLETAEQTQDRAATANVLAIVGIILGTIGTVSGVGSLVMSRRRP